MLSNTVKISCEKKCRAVIIYQLFSQHCDEILQVSYVAKSAAKTISNPTNQSKLAIEKMKKILRRFFYYWVPVIGTSAPQQSHNSKKYLFKIERYIISFFNQSSVRKTKEMFRFLLYLNIRWSKTAARPAT